MTDTTRVAPRKKLTKVRQACDCCHTRKIRCDGGDSCANCEAADLPCTYLIVPKKKGPKGPRTGKTSSTYRKRIIEHMLSGSSAGPRDAAMPALTSAPPPAILPHQTDRASFSTEGAASTNASDFVPSPRVTLATIRKCVDIFFLHKYPIMPILDRQQVMDSLDFLYEDPQQYCLLTALCAMVLLQPEILDPKMATELLTLGDVLSPPEFYIAETRRIRPLSKHIENPTLATVHTSFFLYAAHFSLGRDNEAWFYIREAMTMLQLQRLHEEQSYEHMASPQDATYCRRTFWILFITERAYALQRHHPLTLQRTLCLPRVTSDPEAVILSGFLDLVSLFQNFDDSFLALWNLSSTDAAASPTSLVLLQDILKFALPDVSHRTIIQQADLLVSRQWLKTMVWQLCVTKGMLSSSASNEAMSFHYPITITRDVILASRNLPSTAFAANGIGILEKIFDIGCSLADVLLIMQPNGGSSCSYHPLGQPQALEIGPRDYFIELMRIISDTPLGNSKYSTLLAAKANECLQPSIGAGLSLSDSDGYVSGSGSVDSHMIEEVFDDEFADEAPEPFLGHGAGNSLSSHGHGHGHAQAPPIFGPLNKLLLLNTAVGTTNTANNLNLPVSVSSSSSSSPASSDTAYLRYQTASPPALMPTGIGPTSYPSHNLQSQSEWSGMT